MNQVIKNLLIDNTGDYILPFFWQRNEEETVIRDYMRKINDCGIKQVCLESRPHPDFCGEKWWHDLDIIFDEADRLGMRVWVLDDRVFPTGSANGRGALLPENLKKTYLHLKYFDAVGPARCSHFILKTKNDKNIINYISAIAVKVKKTDGKTVLTDETIDLSNFIEKDKLWLDLPEGIWKIYVVYEKSGRSDSFFDTRINPIIGESTDVLLEEVYEKHYKKYKNRFGNSFAGFFSDESGFYNIGGFKGKLGADETVRLPWGANVPAELQKEYGENWRVFLPFLWIESEIYSSLIRYSYMNVLTRLYEINFTVRIGDWCKKHNIEYIGHIVEDNNNHSRLATGAGHFFRATAGQDMSGIDVVLNQLLPDLDYEINNYEKWDGEFFHYALAKLGFSAAVIDIKKQNRALCEIFGAYGWHEGLKLMKWLADHMLVRGINYFVPHAFSMAQFPDSDCPPHFYAHGNNPQFRYFKCLIRYMNRMSYLLSQGNCDIRAAILYNAELEWCGESMLIQKPARELTQNQIDFVFLPVDAIKASDGSGYLKVNNKIYDVLIIPYASKLPYYIAEKLFELCKSTKVLFVDAFPTELIGGNGDNKLLNALKADAMAVPLHALAQELKGLRSVLISNQQKDLRIMHRKINDNDIYFCFNESGVNNIDCRIAFDCFKPIYAYDAMNNKLSELPYSNGFSLQMKPYESRVIISGCLDVPAQKYRTEKSRVVISDVGFELSLRAYNENIFNQVAANIILEDMSGKDLYTDFCGTFRYETVFKNSVCGRKIVLDLGSVYETAEVYLNRKRVGVCISEPYVFDITDFLVCGENILTIYVTNTLVKTVKDRFSADIRQEPSGLLGPVSLIVYD